jgi:E3 ubiquitin-protein ligase SHPRH
MEEANEIIEGALNTQTELLWKWRSQIYKLLTRSLSATEADAADGEEYSRTLETQGEAEVYLQAYTALLADRREILIAERTALAIHESREKKKRKTVVAAKATAALADTEELDRDKQRTALERENVDLQPEHEVLFDELNELRRNIMTKFNGRAVKSVVVQLATTGAKIANSDDPEKVIAKRCAQDLRKLIADQSR